MEWVLQVVDEIDDAVGALRLASAGWTAELGLAGAGALGIAAICAGIAVHAEVSVIAAASILLSLAAGLKVQEMQLRGPL